MKTMYKKNMIETIIPKKYENKVIYTRKNGVQLRRKELE
jgi:hypothetical protein